MHSVGDKVRHRQRPEWGVGTITKIETVTLRGQRDQRIWIRFANAGLKTVLASLAELDPADSSAGILGGGAAAPGAPVDDTLLSREARHESGWLGSIAKRKPEEAMTSIPATATDVFLSIQKRIEFVLSLYRFESSGGKLIDWAVAQSGLDDPLSRFSRHELEAFFSRWAFDRDATLARLVHEARRNFLDIEDLLRSAPPAAQRALRKLTVAR
jgi:hypothetical protein